MVCVDWFQMVCSVTNAFNYRLFGLSPLKRGLTSRSVTALWFRLAKNLDHLLVHLLVRSHRSLICLLRTAHFARALHCAHLFACLFTLFIPKLLRKCVILSQNYFILNHSAISPAQQTQMLTSNSLSDCGRCVASRIDSNGHAAEARTSVM